MDIVIVMVKCTQTETVLRSAQNCIGPETVIVTLQNGLGNDDECKKFVSADRVLFGSGNIAAELADRAGHYLEECFAKGGLTPKYFDDVRPYIWKKATSNSGNNTVCAALGLKIKEVDADPNGRQLVMGVFREAAAVAEAMGIPGIWEYIQADQPHVVESIGDYYPSMAQDVLIYHRQTEVDYMTGAIARYGRQYGVPTPTCDVLTLIIKTKQANYDIAYRESLLHE